MLLLLCYHQLSFVVQGFGIFVFKSNKQTSMIPWSQFHVVSYERSRLSAQDAAFKVDWVSSLEQQSQIQATEAIHELLRSRS